MWWCIIFLRFDRLEQKAQELLPPKLQSRKFAPREPLVHAIDGSGGAWFGKERSNGRGAFLSESSETLIKGGDKMDLKKHEELLKKLQTEYPTAILDGATDNKEWSKLPKEQRILWILKEVNDYAGDLRSLLDPTELCGYSKWQATYGLIAKVSYGILTGKWVEDADRLVKDEKVLQKIAVINVNKLGGTNRTNQQNLAEAAEEFHDIILKQIELLDPDIIILGGVKNVLSKWLPDNDAKRKWIIADHPGQTKITHKEYYDKVVNYSEEV